VVKAFAGRANMSNGNDVCLWNAPLQPQDQSQQWEIMIEQGFIPNLQIAPPFLEAEGGKKTNLGSGDERERKQN
jgi:hypothetical protein